jgi:hypothetical protein
MRRPAIPVEPIRYTAKTGFITKKMWIDHFFEGGSSVWLHKSWSLLMDRKHFQKYPYGLIPNVLVLNRKNKNVIATVCGLAARPPFPTQIEHDNDLNEVLLRLSRCGTISEWTTEAELKAAGGQTFQIGSQGNLIKYPDALVRVSGQGRSQLWAIEMELTIKTRKRYVQIMSAYATMKNLDGILYVHSAPTIVDAVEDGMQGAFFPSDRLKVGFVSVDDWLKSDSELKFEVGPRSQIWSN